VWYLVITMMGGHIIRRKLNEHPLNNVL